MNLSPLVISTLELLILSERSDDTKAVYSSTAEIFENLREMNSEESSSYQSFASWMKERDLFSTTLGLDEMIPIFFKTIRMA